MDARNTVRRGALLLLVLGVLTLFLLMGTMMLTLATRTRTTAKAFAAVTAGQAARPLLARRQLEQAILSLVRGGTDARAAGMTESLLGDMYGTALPLEGRVTSLVARGPLIEATVQMTGSSVRASELCGRVITFKPAPESGDAFTSLRVLRASGTGALTCWMAGWKANVDAPLPRVPCAVLVNQPAFRTEAYDAYDPENEWLTEARLRDGMVSEVPHPAFETNNVNVPAEFGGSHQVAAVFVRKLDVITVGQPIVSLRSAGGETRDLVSPKAGKIRGLNVAPGQRVTVGDTVVTLEAAAQVDNDNDGVNDGVWLTDMFGSLPVPGGGYFKFDASYLVIDLDSRINLNAHGSRTSLDLPAADGWWADAPAVPAGSGYGPADIDASILFIDPLRSNQTQSDPPVASNVWRRVLGITGTSPWPMVTATTGSMSQRRPTPQVGVVEGKYGPSRLTAPPLAEPGAYGNDPISRRNESLYRLGGRNTTKLEAENARYTGTKNQMSDPVTSGSTTTFIGLNPPGNTVTFTLSGTLMGVYELAIRCRAPAGDARVSGTLVATVSGKKEQRSVIDPRDQSSGFIPRSAEFMTRDCGLINLTGTNELILGVNPQHAPYDIDHITLTPVNPFCDLKCMFRSGVETTERNSSLVVPNMVHFCPDWWRAGFVDDPYEIRLDADAPRPGNLRSSGTSAGPDNPFTPAELEAVLRQFDNDAAALPPRLAVALDQASQRSRLLVTTDSWDTPGLTGVVAQEIADYIAALRCDPLTVMSPDVLGGLRFDINRHFYDEDTLIKNGKLDSGEDLNGDGRLDTLAESKQEFCKHLYTLLVALGQPASAVTAQWAVNVVDFRDDDSTFTRFQFDTDPTDGWGPGTNGWDALNTVWGLERPEAVIAQTTAFYMVNNTGTTTQDGLYVSLYRPAWTEKLATGGGGRGPSVVQTNSAPTLDLAEKAVQSSWPVWRLRIEPGTFVRFDSPGSGEKEVSGVFRKTGGAKDDAVMAPDSYLVVMPAPVKTTGNSGTSAINVPVDAAFKKFEINSGGQFKATSWPGAASYQAGADTIVFLERLEDQTKPWNDNPASPDYNPYVILDRMGVKRVNRTNDTGNNWKTYIREDSVWNNGPFETTGVSLGMVPLDPAVKSWLPWPNRPFISHAELVLVPRGNGVSRFWDYKIPKNKAAQNPYYELPTPKLLDATIVPSRFAGSQVSVDPAALAPVGMSRIPYNQLSRWREPGRVNLNTIVTNTNCADPQRDDAVWWAAMGPDVALSRDEFTAALPAKSLAEMMTLMQGQGLYLDSNAQAGVKGNSWKKNRPYDENPQAAYATAIRMANVATIRSHVFAVWVTLRVRDTSPGGITSYHRAFAIIDRSRPVGFADGQDLNVRDTIRVLRFLE